MKLTLEQRQRKLTYARKAAGMYCRALAEHFDSSFTLDKLLRYGNSYIAVLTDHKTGQFGYSKASQSLNILEKGAVILNDNAPNKYTQFAVDMLHKFNATDWGT